MNNDLAEILDNGKIIKISMQDKCLYLAKWKPIYKIFTPKYKLIYVEIKSEDDKMKLNKMLSKIEGISIEIID